MQQRNEVQKMNMTQTGADNLRVAIVNRACEDYILAVCGSKVDNKDPDTVISQVERFFRSQWFSSLAQEGIDPEACISVCKERGRYAKWRISHKCNACNHKKCPHKLNGGNFTLQKVCEKDKKLC